ncbi:Sodium-dependent neutral amino acid transporter SLC6A17 [Portunus trituberculatus]|uniref:Sodium-dependent neutral amino acid transporter SLC6A17 n=1 Tax=Portunus trituberculatus TaxID=210409 RepID=A0A5B7ESX1_PORTR|nr:Sodium-dependent neutral amino acid transporter SLC6A17 [Portunus trituberculatus]
MEGWLAGWLRRQDRGIYKNSKEAFLALVGFSVGLGNFWRFPTSAFEFKGATFLIAYIICLLSMGLPLLILEISLGQYHQRGPAHIFSRMCRPLSDCMHYTMEDAFESANRYFNESIGGLSTETEHPYEMHHWLMLCLGVAWVLVIVCLIQGVRHSGKVFYVTVLYPYVVLLCLFGLSEFIPFCCPCCLLQISQPISQLIADSIIRNYRTHCFVLPLCYIIPIFNYKIH